jgi:imidazolonepropionase-like amidohydrolase
MIRTLLSAGSVFDVVSGETLQADVVVAGDRIVEVGCCLDGDQAVNCNGLLIVPGFIDCHTHVALTGVLGAARTHRLPRSARALSAVPVLRALLGLGVTTIRDASGADIGLRMALEQGWIQGPQMLLSLRQLCTTGGIGDRWSPELGSIADQDPVLPDPVFDGPDAARAAVRRMVRAGADWIKVTATGSLVQGDRAFDVQLTEAEMFALVDEAVRQGDRGVMVHAHNADAAELAARAGARSIEHAIWLDERAVAAMAESSTWLVPTLSVTQADPEAGPAGAAEAHRRSVALAIAAGVPIAMGTDSPVRPHSEALREIEYLSDAGLGPIGAFRAATLEAAKLLRLADDRGEIAPGKRADLVLFSGTSLNPVDLEQRIAGVWHNGNPISASTNPRR